MVEHHLLRHKNGAAVEEGEGADHQLDQEEELATIDHLI